MLYCEYICPRCKQKVGYTFFDMTLDQFAVAMLDGSIRNNENQNETSIQEEKKNEENAKPVMKKNKSKISSAEQKAALKMLENSPNWADWLGKIGAPTEEIIEDQNDCFRLDKEEDDEQGH